MYSSSSNWGRTEFILPDVLSILTIAWVTQQGRQMVWDLEEREIPMRSLIHDHDRKFIAVFDTVFASEPITVLHTLSRTQCLGGTLGTNRAHRMPG
jgi:hypothetical protein